MSYKTTQPQSYHFRKYLNLIEFKNKILKYVESTKIKDDWNNYETFEQEFDKMAKALNFIYRIKFLKVSGSWKLFVQYRHQSMVNDEYYRGLETETLDYFHDTYTLTSWINNIIIKPNSLFNQKITTLEQLLKDSHYYYKIWGNGQ